MSDVRRSINDFSNDVQHILKSMCYNYKDATLAGSAGKREFIFPADYDLYEVVKTKNVLQIQNIVKCLLDMKDVYIGDIKWGEKNGEPLRWKPADILKGSKDGVTLEQAIKTGLCKMDVVAFLDNVYTDVSIIYDFGYSKIKNINDSLAADKLELTKEGNYYKASKRHLSGLLHSKKETDQVKKLTQFFNGNCGLLYQILSNIKTLMYMFENFHRLSFTKIDAELDTMINRLSSCFYIIPSLHNPEKVNGMLRQMQGIPNTPKNFKLFERKLQKLYNYLNGILQKTTRQYLADNKINFT